MPVTSSAAAETPALTPPSPALLLRDRRFLLLWLSQMISSLGDWALLVAIPVAVYTGTGSKIALGFSVISETLPVLLFGLLGGVLADRWNRQRTMIAADLGRAAAVLLLLGVADTRHFSVRDLCLYYAVSFVAASFSCFFSPARASLMPAFLPREQLLQANGLMLSGIQITMLLGPALGGLLLGWAHPHGVFLFDAATFLLSALLIKLMPPIATPPAEKALRGMAGVWEDARLGLGYVWHNETLRATLTLLAVAVLGGCVYNTLEFAFVKDLWHGTPRQFGLLISVGGLATLLTSLLATGPARSASPVALLGPGFAVMAVSGLVLACTGSLLVGGAMLFIMGIGNTLVNLGLMTLFQMTASSQYQGRVSATINLINRLAMALGGVVATGLVALFPATLALRFIFGGVAGVFLLSGLLAYPLLHPQWRRLEADQAVPASTPSPAES